MGSIPCSDNCLGKERHRNEGELRALQTMKFKGEITLVVLDQKKKNIWSCSA